MLNEGFRVAGVRVDVKASAVDGREDVKVSGCVEVRLFAEELGAEVLASVVLGGALAGGEVAAVDVVSRADAVFDADG